MLIELDGVRPQVAEGVYIAPTAVLIGDVTVGAGSSIWFGAVLRGDSGRIIIGERVSVQDNVVIHVNERADTVVGDDVLIGHGAVLEGCHIGQGALIGMHATVLSGARVGERSLVAAGSLVREGAEIPVAVLAAGVPAEVKGELPLRAQERMQLGPRHYTEMAQRYMHGARRLDAGGSEGRAGD
jgi:carbonic anhydrase/acetyltransferase-like protein (isoleucine patch superfamily)